MSCKKAMSSEVFMRAWSGCRNWVRRRGSSCASCSMVATALARRSYQGNHRTGEPAHLSSWRCRRRRSGENTQCTALHPAPASRGRDQNFDRAGTTAVGGTWVLDSAPSGRSAAFWRTSDCGEGDGGFGNPLIKYWLEVSPEEQTRRLTDRITDWRSTGSSPLDLASYTCWDEYVPVDEMSGCPHRPGAVVCRGTDDVSGRLAQSSSPTLLGQVPCWATKRSRSSCPSGAAARGGRSSCREAGARVF
jgi:hypothetical protein